jgi:hypothetical protein
MGKVADGKGLALFLSNEQDSIVSQEILCHDKIKW